jgi:hypothetical protein
MGDLIVQPEKYLLKGGTELVPLDADDEVVEKYADGLIQCVGHACYVAMELTGQDFIEWGAHVYNRQIGKQVMYRWRCMDILFHAKHKDKTGALFQQMCDVLNLDTKTGQNYARLAERIQPQYRKWDLKVEIYETVWKLPEPEREEWMERVASNHDLQTQPEILRDQVDMRLLDLQNESTRMFGEDGEVKPGRPFKPVKEKHEVLLVIHFRKGDKVELTVKTKEKPTAGYLNFRAYASQPERKRPYITMVEGAYQGPDEELPFWHLYGTAGVPNVLYQEPTGEMQVPTLRGKRAAPKKPKKDRATTIVNLDGALPPEQRA